MENREPIPVKRKLMLVVLASGVALSLAAVIISFAVNAVGSPQSTKQSTLASPADSPAAQQVPPLASEGAGQSFQSNFAIPEGPSVTQGIEHEIKLVGILPVPRIVRLDNAGDSQQLLVQGYYSDGTVGDLQVTDGATITYTSFDPSVAEVSPLGVVTAMKKGGADIEVSYGSLTTDVTVLVWGQFKGMPPVDPHKLLRVSDGTYAIVLNRIMVELQPGYGLAEAEQLAVTLKGSIVYEFRAISGYMMEIEVETEDDLNRTIDFLLADPRVISAFPDITLSSNQGVKIDTLRNSLKNRWAYSKSGIEEAWDVLNGLPKTGLKPVVIAIIDADFVASAPDTRHPARRFTGNGDPGFDELLNWELDPTNIYVRHGGKSHTTGPHGTAVASIIVAGNYTEKHPLREHNLSGVVSSVNGLEYTLLVYPGATKKAVGELGEQVDALTFGDVLAAMDDVAWYLEQVDVVNISFKMGPVGKWAGMENMLKSFMEEQNNLTFVVAAGNDGKDAKDAFPANVSNLDNVITVGGVMHEPSSHPANSFSWRWATWLEKCGFIFKCRKTSNFGDDVTLGAPGHHVLALTDSGYSFMSGTSFAAPLVSGTVALIKSLRPSLKPFDIKTTLVETAHTSHEVCKNGQHSYEISTIADESECEELPILDAGAAIQEYATLNANILEASQGLDVHPQIERVVIIPDVRRNQVWLTVLVTNDDVKRSLQINGEATSRKSRRTHQFGPLREPRVLPGQTAYFTTPIPELQFGDWKDNRGVIRRARGLNHSHRFYAGDDPSNRTRHSGGNGWSKSCFCTHAHLSITGRSANGESRTTTSCRFV